MQSGQRQLSEEMTMRKSSLPTIVGCLCVQLCMGVVYLWSAFKASAMEFYGWADGPANMVTSFMMMGFCVGSMTGGTIQDAIGPRKVSMIGCVLFGGGIFAASCIPAGGSVVLFYFSYCVVGGLGSGFVYGSAISCLQKWMPHRRGLAAGLAASAFGLSTVVFSPLVTWMLGRMDISGVLRVLAVAFFLVGMAACVFIRLPDRADCAAVQSVPEDDGSRNLSQALRTFPYWCLVAGMFFFNGTWSMINPLIKGLGMERGLSEAAAVLTLSLTGVTNALGRLTMAALSDKIGRIPTINILAVVTTVAALLLVFVGGPVYSIAVLISAFAYGGPAAVYPALTSDLYGPKYSGANYGFIMLALGASFVVFNVLSNILYEYSGAYVLTFLVGAVSAVIAIVTMLMLRHQIKTGKLAEARPKH